MRAILFPPKSLWGDSQCPVHCTMPLPGPTTKNRFLDFVHALSPGPASRVLEGLCSFLEAKGCHSGMDTGQWAVLICLWGLTGPHSCLPCGRWGQPLMVSGALSSRFTLQEVFSWWAGFSGKGCLFIRVTELVRVWGSQAHFPVFSQHSLVMQEHAGRASLEGPAMQCGWLDGTDHEVERGLHVTRPEGSPTWRDSPFWRPYLKEGHSHWSKLEKREHVHKEKFTWLAFSSLILAFTEDRWAVGKADLSLLHWLPPISALKPSSQSLLLLGGRVGVCRRSARSEQNISKIYKVRWCPSTTPNTSLCPLWSPRKASLLGTQKLNRLLLMAANDATVLESNLQ